MNKKIKALVALTLIIQLLIPSYLLIYHYTVLDAAFDSETEYRFRIYDMDFDAPPLINTTDDCLGLYFDIENAILYNSAPIAVSTDENGQAVLSVLESKWQTDNWFDYKIYEQNSYISKVDFTFEPDIDAVVLMNEIRSNFLWLNRNNKYNPGVYVTAKVHKGIFIPTAVYYGEVKVITIHLSALSE